MGDEGGSGAPGAAERARAQRAFETRDEIIVSKLRTHVPVVSLQTIIDTMVSD